jgi:hypothetical protein
MHSHPHGNAPVWDTFATGLSKMPFCTDDPRRGVHREPRSIALQHRNIEINRPSAVFWLPFDVDRADAVDAWEQGGQRAPNFIAQNPSNGHALIGYALATAIARHDAANHRPLAFAAAVERGLSRRLRADPGYRGFMAKNPLHPHWRTQWLAPQPYALADLAACLTAEDMRAVPTPELEIGLGRNCSLFDAVRAEAYRIVDGFRDAGDRDAGDREGFAVRVLLIATEFNQGFAAPLFPNEVRATARSISKWTWANYGLGNKRNRRASSEFHAARGRLSGLIRVQPALARQRALRPLLSDSSWPLLREIEPGVAVSPIATTQTGISARTRRRDLAAVRGGPVREKPVEVFGRVMTMTQAAAAAGVSKAAYSRRLAKGIEPTAAAIMPRRDGKRTHSLTALGIEPGVFMARVRAACERELMRT